VLSSDVPAWRPAGRGAAHRRPREQRHDVRPARQPGGSRAAAARAEEQRRGRRGHGAAGGAVRARASRRPAARVQHGQRPRQLARWRARTSPASPSTCRRATSSWPSAPSTPRPRASASVYNAAALASRWRTRAAAPRS
jgi:hypothetical protein